MVGEIHITDRIDYSVTCKCVTETLKYFNLFRFPLRLEEVHKFLSITITKADLATVLSQMVSNDELYHSAGMYSLDDSADIFARRVKGEQMAAGRMTEARTSAKIIAAFPFVKSVCVSGSLSKGFADEKSDIDFFIIAADHRMWVCRTILHVFKKFTFLLNKQHSFCMNYFIDETMLCLDEKNRFTATELSTLIPMYSREVYSKLIDSNKGWIDGFFPNVVFDNTVFCRGNKKHIIKPVLENLLNILWPTHLNNLLMRLTDAKWRRKWAKKNYPMEEYDLAMKTRWYVSKQHPLNYQKRVLSANAALVTAAKNG